MRYECPNDCPSDFNQEGTGSVVLAVKANGCYDIDWLKSSIKPTGEVRCNRCGALAREEENPS